MAKSGTHDLKTWAEFPGYDELRATCESFGSGKYVLFERGAGIRGMRKINEVVIEKSNTVHNTQNLENLLVFAAEELGLQSDTVLAVKKNMPLKELSDQEVVKVLDDMTKTEVSSAEEFNSFVTNVKSLVGEIKKRGMSSEGFVPEVAEQAIAEAESKKSFGSGLTFGAGLLVGGLGGVAATAWHYRSKIEDMETRMAAMETSMQETEKEMKAESDKRESERRAAEAVAKFDRNIGIDNNFLANFNLNNPAKNL